MKHEGRLEGREWSPRGARIDWIFGSRGDFSKSRFDHGAQVSRATDHQVGSARFTAR